MAGEVQFPAETRPKLVQEFQEIVKVKASNRTEAANKAWADNGPKWLAMMGPKQTTKRIISLYVDEPKAGVGGKLGRLEPIRVYVE